MRKLLTLALIPFFLMQGCQPNENRDGQGTIAGKIDDIFDTIPDFSGVVLFADDGKPSYFKSFGVRNFETNDSIKTDDIFELASVSKQFTAMVIIILEEKGLINYDELIEKYFADLPYKGITVRHLLTHTSGLPDYQVIMDEHWDKSKVANNPDILEYLIKYQPPALFAPGEKYQYSNTGYVLLGSIAEKASGVDFVAFCQENIFDPLGMTSTKIRSNDEKITLTNLAYGHIFVPEKKRYVRADSFPSSNYTIWLGGRKGPGRVSSMAEDLLKWDQALYTEQLVSNASIQEAFTPQKLNDGSESNYGFGWMLKPNAPEGNVVWHNGDNPGYKTIIVRYLDKKMTLIILNNNYHPQFEAVREAIDSLIAMRK